MGGGIVYLVTCRVTGKHYVGQTTRTLEERWSQHLGEAGPGRFETPLHRAIRKYGPGAFDVRVLERVENRADLNRVEAECAARYKSLVPEGYGLRAGNAMGSAFSALTINRMRVAAKSRMERPGAKERQRTVQPVAQMRPEVRSVKSEAAKSLWRDSAYRRRQEAVRSGEPYRTMDSMLRSIEWTDPKIRAKHLAGLKAAAPLLSEASRARWSDPAYRERLSAAQRLAWGRRKKEKAEGVGVRDREDEAD